jgi:hypothetical protein
MNTLNANNIVSNPQPLVPALARFAIAVAVVLALTAVWIGAESQSHQAVDMSTMAITSPANTNVRYVNLPSVTVIGTRSAKAHAA